MNTANQPQPCVATLLALADLILGQARRLENLSSRGDRLERHFSAVKAGESLRGVDYFLRLVQARRDAGGEVPDVEFFSITWFAERWASEAFDTDTKLSELHAQMEKIREREQADWDWDDPDAPQDYQRMADQWNCRIHELQQVEVRRFLRFLLRHGETSMADLYLHDRASFDRRREAGRCALFGPIPDIRADTGEGDTGLTQVVTGDE